MKAVSEAETADVPLDDVAALQGVDLRGPFFLLLFFFLSEVDLHRHFLFLLVAGFWYVFVKDLNLHYPRGVLDFVGGVKGWRRRWSEAARMMNETQITIK